MTALPIPHSTKKPDPAEVERFGSELADAVTQIAESFKTLRKHVTDDLIVLLIHDTTKVGKRDIEKILRAVPDLSKRYLRRTP